MPARLLVKNWDEFQHYKDRNPPWIKLHRALLDDYEFSQLPDAAKAHLMLIWLFASHNDGCIPHDPEFLARKVGAMQSVDLELLLERGFLIPERRASDMLDDCKQPASSALALARSRETEAETETEHGRRKGDPLPGFEEFWAAYPKKRHKGKAEAAWRKVDPGLLPRILQAVEVAKTRDDWRKEKGQFIPYPASWLNAKGWEDEAPAPEAKRVVI